MAVLSLEEMCFLLSFSSPFFLFLFLLLKVSSTIFTSPELINSFSHFTNTLKQSFLSLTHPTHTHTQPSHSYTIHPLLHRLIMSSSYTSPMYAGTLPMSVPGKDDYPGYYNGYQSGHSTYSVSPPESENVSSASGSASYGHSGYSASASYAGSMQGEYDSSVSAANVDFNEYMQDRFNDSFNPIPLDKSVAMQAQT